MHSTRLAIISEVVTTRDKDPSGVTHRELSGRIAEAIERLGSGERLIAILVVIEDDIQDRPQPIR